MAGAGMVLGLCAFAIGAQPAAYGDGPYLLLMGAGGFVTLGLGIAAYISANGIVLGLFMAAIVAMWCSATVHHRRRDSKRTSRSNHEGRRPKVRVRHRHADPLQFNASGASGQQSDRMIFGAKGCAYTTRGSWIGRVGVKGVEGAKRRVPILFRTEAGAWSLRSLTLSCLG